MNKLFFGMGNAKLPLSVATFSIPAGFTCPFAKDCLSKANRITGKITDGKHCRYRCFAASQECVFPSLRRARWNNFNLLQKTNRLEDTANLIQRSLPFGIGIVRMHVSGDFYSEKYFLAWLNVAHNNPMVVFYAYTKALPFWIKYKKHIPPNFRLTASTGGIHDYLIKKHKLKYADVVFSTEEARRKGLELDHDDSHAMIGKEPFALLIHGTQPVNTDASKAWRALIKQGQGGYNEKTKQARIERPVKMYVTLRQGEIFLPQSVKYTPKIGKNTFPLTFTWEAV
jgi:hypothetical protein